MSLPEGQDWANYQVAAPSLKGLDFVFVKATEGVGYVNPKHDVQVAHARDGGLVVGHYHFQRPGSAVAQAAYFLKHAKPAPGDVLACDWEDTGVPDEDKDTFLRAVKAARPDLRAVLYCNRDFWLHRDSTSYCADGLWIADPSAPKGQPRIEHPWLFHQYSSAGGLDRNVSGLSAGDLRAWAASTTPAPSTTPTVQEDDMPTPHDLWAYRNADMAKRNPQLPQAYGYLIQTANDVKALKASVAALTATVKTLAGLADQNVDTATVVTAVQDAIADATVHVTVDVTGDQPTA